MLLWLKAKAKAIDEAQISKLIQEMPLSLLSGLRVCATIDNEKFTGTITDYWNELEGYKYTIKYDDGDAEEFSEKGGGKYIKAIQQFKNAIIVAYVSNDGNISDLHDRNCKRHKPSKKPSDHRSLLWAT
jgi:hypothetical protein